MSLSMHSNWDEKHQLLSNRTLDLRDALRIAQYVYPIVLWSLSFVQVACFKIAAWKSDPNSARPPSSGPVGRPLPATDATRKFIKNTARDDITKTQRKAFRLVSSAVVLTFLGNLVLVTAQIWTGQCQSWQCGQSVWIYLAGSCSAYCVSVWLLSSKPSPTAAHVSTWSVGSVLDISLIAVSLALYKYTRCQPTDGHRLCLGMTIWEASEIAFGILRITFLLVLLGLYLLSVVLLPVRKSSEAGSPSETASLLATGDDRLETCRRSGTCENISYGSMHQGGGKQQHAENTPPAWSGPAEAPTHGWWEYIKGYGIFLPYLWPSEDRRLQVMVIICFVLVMAQRVVNLLVPDQLGHIVDRLEQKAPGSPWTAICLFIAFQFLQGPNGVLGAARSALWIPVSQYSYHKLSVASFEHVHSLSLEFHLGKKTGEVISALSKGRSINAFLEQVIFFVIPMFLDLGAALGYLTIRYGLCFALFLAIKASCYICLTISMSRWRAGSRRELVDANREEDAIKNESISCYETVKYFNADAFEFKRYRQAVERSQDAEWKALLSVTIMNITQNMVFKLGLMVITFVTAYQVRLGAITSGNFVTLIAFMNQLEGPLNLFAASYKTVQSAMINSERMLELFREQATVVDKEGAAELSSCKGDLELKDVSFSYDNRKTTLSNLNIRCLPGTTTAIVGESGSGKSTVFHLLYRFHNTSSGQIEVDDNNVADLTIESVRRHIGVVPQNDVLFNETLMYNLKYANHDATDAQVHDACRAASIHDKILTFPGGYQTKVGERGLRLSGGEKQRIAIARTILKDPRILLLDEATAALDTETEQQVQEALKVLARGRTTLIIAHRLSTITQADQILVLNKGKVQERGTHSQLLERGGLYAAMWKRQIQAQRENVPT